MAEEKGSATNATETNKEQTAALKDKPNTETSKAPEKSVWETAAETIAGDNKLMETLLKIVLSPINLLASAGLIVFCFFKLKEQKAEIEKIKTEYKELDEKYTHIKKKYKKLKEENEKQETTTVSGLNFRQQQVLPMENQIQKKKTYQSNFLD